MLVKTNAFARGEDGTGQDKDAVYLEASLLWTARGLPCEDKSEQKSARHKNNQRKSKLAVTKESGKNGSNSRTSIVMVARLPPPTQPGRVVPPGRRWAMRPLWAAIDVGDLSQRMACALEAKQPRRVKT